MKCHLCKQVLLKKQFEQKVLVMSITWTKYVMVGISPTRMLSFYKTIETRHVFIYGPGHRDIKIAADIKVSLRIFLYRHSLSVKTFVDWVLNSFPIH